MHFPAFQFKIKFHIHSFDKSAFYRFPLLLHFITVIQFFTHNNCFPMPLHHEFFLYTLYFTSLPVWIKRNFPEYITLPLFLHNNKAEMIIMNSCELVTFISTAACALSQNCTEDKLEILAAVFPSLATPWTPSLYTKKSAAVIK